MVKQHKLCTISELEEMIPFERDVYIMLIKQEMEKLEEESLQQKLTEKALRERGY